MTPHSRPAASERKVPCAPRQRLAKAAGAAVEALEKRQLLAAAPAIDYSIWLHPDPAFRRDLLAEEHAHPAFAALLEADLRAHGLPALDPAAAALLPTSGAGSGVAAASVAFLASRHGPRRHLVRDHKTRMHPAHAHLAGAHHTVARGHHPAAHHTVAHPHHPRPHRPHPVHGHFGFAVSPSGPMVNNAAYTYQTLPQSLAFTFSAVVNGVSLSSITIQNTSTGATLTPLSLSWNGLTATFTLTNSTTPQSGIPDGNYTATLNSQVITDGNGNKLTGSDGIAGDPYTFPFYFLTADVNHDGTDNQTDMNTIVANYGQSNKTYAQGDINYDGGVGFDDLLLLEREYQTTLHIAVPSAPTASPVTSTSVQLTWPAVNDPNVTGYNVNRTDGTVVASNTPATATLDSGLTPATGYTYNLASADAAGEHSLYAPSLTVTTSPASSVPSGYNLGPPPTPINIGRALDGSGQPVITTQTTGTARQDFTGWVGFQFTTQAEPLLVGQLGRYVYSGNSHTHTVKLVDPATGLDVPGGSVNVNTQGATANQYAYTPLPAAITLQPNHIYYLMSYETLGGGDSWYNDDTTVTPTTDIQVNHSEYMDPRNGVYLADQTTNHSYVPVNFKYSVPLDSKLTISWTAPPPATWNPGAGTPVSYEIDRGNVQVGEVDASAGTSNPDGSKTYTYQDTGLDAGQSYNYSVFAFDSTYDRSPAATVSAAAGPDQTKPDAPTDIQFTQITGSSVSLTWVQPWDNTGVVSYRIARSANGGSLVTLATIQGTSFTDSSVQPGMNYYYDIYARDAAGNESSPDEGNAVTPPHVFEPLGFTTPSLPNVVSEVDSGAAQYIPSSYETYFYNTLMPALRQLMVRANAAFDIPHASGWLDPLRTTYSYDTGLWNTTTDLADTAIANGAVVQILQSGSSWYVDANGDGVIDSGDWPLPSDPRLIQSQNQGLLAYRDSYGPAGIGQWNPGDPIWEDLNHDNQWDPGDPILYNPNNVTLHAGDAGRKENISYYDVGGSASERLIWADPSLDYDLSRLDEPYKDFRDDLFRFYPALESLCAFYQDPAAPQGTGWTLGAILDKLNAEPAAGAGGSVNVNQAGQVSLSGVSFPFTLEEGDQILLNSVWYTLTGGVVTDSSQTILSIPGGPFTAPLRIRNFTRIPATPATSNTPALAYERGVYQTSTINGNGLDNVLFPQQFSELHDILQQLASATPINPNYSQSAPTPGPAPTDPIPLTTAMDYYNVMPDTNLDGIVQVPADMQSFGNDTGLIHFEPQRDMAQTYLPLGTVSPGSFPIHYYLEQGAFGTATSDVGTLLDTSSWFSDINANTAGQPFAYSNDTRVRTNLLINDADNHVKRIEIIRPGGNAVVFNFAWNPATSTFSSIGTPVGWNGRDSSRLYVLRDTNLYHEPYYDSGSYDLEFPSGIVQHFDYGLASISDSYAGVSSSGVGGWQKFAGADDFTSGRYNVTVNFQQGRIASVDYQAKDGSQTIHTAIGYAAGSNDVISLTKSDGGNQLTPFSYTLTGGNAIGNNGVTVTRSGSFAGGSVTLKTTLPSDPSLAAGSYRSETWAFNANGLVTSDTVNLSEDGSSVSAATTTYTYASGTGRYTSSAPQWGKVTLINYPDNSWEAFTYDGTSGTNTGWMTEDVTPFKSSTWSAGSENSQIVQYDTYAAADSGGGQGADPSLMVERPRTVTTKVLSVVTAETFNRYGNSYDANGYAIDGPGSFITRKALSANAPNWASAGLWSNVQIVYDATSIAAAAGAVIATEDDITHGITTPQIIYGTKVWWAGKNVSQSQDVRNAFSNAVSGYAEQLDSPYASNTTNAFGSFGRVSSETLAGGLTDGATYATNDWLGPSQVTETDGSTTKYTYTPLGQVATKIIYSGQSNSVMYKYMYDAAGNLVQQTTTAVDANGNPIGSLPVVTNTYAYDAMGRLTKEVDDANGIDATSKRTTTNAYTFDGTYNTTTTTYPDGTTTKIEKDYLDGTPASVSGTGVTPSTYDEGVIAADTTDARGNVETAGSTWTETLTDGGSNYTKTYTNVLGQQYLVQQSGPSTSAASGVPAGSYADQITTFDGNDRPQQVTAVDGTQTITIYDPATGQPGAIVTDIDKDGSYGAGVDRKSIVHPQLNGSTSTSLPQSATDKAGADSQGINSGGNTDDNAVSWNGGLNSSETVDGQTTTDATSLPTGGGNYSHTTTNPDGTQIVDTYASGLLSNEKKLGTDGSTVIWTKTWNYDGLRRLSSYVDYTGTTNYTYFEDGTLKTVQLPGHGVAQMVNNIDANTEQSTNTTRPDSSHVLQDINSLGLQSDHSGAGTIPTRSTYDTAGTGQITSLETYSGAGLGTLGTAGAGQKTGWSYDPATGAVYQKQYADYSQSNPDQVQYQYNLAGQLANVTEPGISGSKFGYNAAGEQVSSSYTDSVSGVVASTLTNQDELGRERISAAQDNGRTFTTLTSYTPLEQLYGEQYASAGGAGTQHVYFPATGFGSTGAPGALQTLTVTPAPGSGAPTVQTSYAYDLTSKRLNQISVNGINFGITYLSNSDQIQQVTAMPNGSTSPTVTTLYNPDTTDEARMGEVKVTSGSSTVYDENIASNYYGNDQRHTETVTRTNPGGGTETHTSTFSYNTQDELTGVTDYLGGGNYSYAYDNAGNRTNLGTVNLVNEYASLTYNARGDVIDDGTNSYGWDAMDRLISVTPDSPVPGNTQEQMGYDAQGRLLWEDVSTFYNCVWNYSNSKHYVWDVSNIVAELDQNNNLLESYTWGPKGLLAVTTYPLDPNNPSPGTTKTYEAVEDASGSVVELVDPTVTTGSVVAAYHYDPFGNLLGSSGVATAVNPFGFQQMLTDASGKYYDNARWYDPVTGRFESRDPIGEGGGMNIYVFGQNDPINNGDSTGLESRGITQISLEAIDQAKQEYGATWLQNYDWIYKAKVDWYRARNIDIVVPPNPDGAPSMYYLPPTNGQVVKQYAKEVLNAVNANTGAVVNLPATVVNNQIANWHNDFRYPVADNRAGIYQLPIIDAQVQNDYNADPKADTHTATLTNAVGAASSIGLFVAGVPRIAPSGPAAASNIVVDTGGVASAPFRFTEQSLAPAGSVETPAEFLTRLTQDYKNALPTQATPVGTPASVFEIQNTGPLNYLLRGGGVRLWADGINQAVVLEAKFIGNAETSPFVAGSRIPDQVRQMILADVNDEFRRLGLIIRDGANPLLSVRVITNNAAAKGYFESLLKQHNIPGEVVVR